MTERNEMTIDAHTSDCAVHNMPAEAAGECDCSQIVAVTRREVSLKAGKLSRRMVASIHETTITTCADGSVGMETQTVATVYRKALVPLFAAAPGMLKALQALNQMGGDERGGYCVCPLNDGSAPDERHATACAMARAAIAKATA